MRENVVRALTRWTNSRSLDRLPDDPPSAEGGMVMIDAFETVIGIYEPRADEPMVSLLVSQNNIGGRLIIDAFTIRIELIRHDREESEVLLGEVAAACFGIGLANRLPYHGNISVRDCYRIYVTNLSQAIRDFQTAVLVYQP